MSYHKELLNEIIANWTIEQMDNYISELMERRVELDKWIRHVQMVRRRRVRKEKKPLDTGDRHGT